MSDLFASNNLVSVDVCYTVEKNKLNFPSVTILTDEEAAKMKADPAQKDKVRVLMSKWRPQSWKTANDLLLQAQSYNFHTQEFEIDWTKHRDARLKTLLADWDGVDVKDAEGNAIPCTTENINKLHVAIALALLTKYDKLTTPDKEAVTKNS